jgi:hypothetical protein
MKHVCVKLPWIVMKNITGMPESDIPKASELVREMGNFVGKPYDPALMARAATAQRQMVGMIKQVNLKIFEY